MTLQGKNLACAKMAPRKQEGCARSSHVTGQRSLRGRGSRKGLQRAPTNTMLFSDYHLAKLNPKCHMNYSIIFTEISFSPETSNLLSSNIFICQITLILALVPQSKTFFSYKFFS